MTQPITEPRIDLDAYFQRIGYDGERAPTLATLRAIHRFMPPQSRLRISHRCSASRFASTWLRSRIS
jgi:hypothetical protein